MQKTVEALEELLESCEALETCVADIRFQHWPPKFESGAAEDMDIMLQNSERAINKAKRAIKAETSNTEKIKRRALDKLTEEERKALGY